MYKIALLVCMLVVATSIVVNAQAGGAAAGLPLGSRGSMQAQLMRQRAMQQRGPFGGGMNNMLFYMMMMDGFGL